MKSFVLTPATVPYARRPEPVPASPAVVAPRPPENDTGLASRLDPGVPGARRTRAPGGVCRPNVGRGCRPRDYRSRCSDSLQHRRLGCKARGMDRGDEIVAFGIEMIRRRDAGEGFDEAWTAALRAPTPWQTRCVVDALAHTRPAWEHAVDGGAGDAGRAGRDGTARRARGRCRARRRRGTSRAGGVGPSALCPHILATTRRSRSAHAPRFPVLEPDRGW
jgi:hypothetical protein